MALKKFLLFVTVILASGLSPARGQFVPTAGTGATKWAPAQKPTMVGPIKVGIVLVLFPDTELRGGIERFKRDLDSVNGLSQEEYFKIYSDDITWPVPTLYPSEDPKTIYHAPQLYGYYCKFDFWGNPIGWHSTEEGAKRANLLKAEALRNARNLAPGVSYKTVAVSFITTTITDKNTRPDIRRYYAGACNADPKIYPDPAAWPASKFPPGKAEPPDLISADQVFDPWQYYRPGVAWGEPMWPNSSIQFNNASAGTFAHEFGHVEGAPDIYRIGRTNDGIGGTPVLLNYGPTATAFSRFYHHGFVPEKNYPTITKSGTYTLSPRHITPEADQSLGFIIPSRHPHYYYHIEYLYSENPALGAGGGEEGSTRNQNYHGNGSVEGVLISVIDLGQSNYLGSPDGFYTYRPNDPWFRGGGDTGACLFGAAFDRQAFNLTTEPSSRLPNLLDGGVSFKNITEHQGTATFDVEIDNKPLPPAVVQASLLPLVKLEPIDELLPTSFRMAVTMKYRGEPLVDQYGMCWSMSKKPEVGNDHFILSNCNYEMYQGRALNLRPGTTYYVRGWASNANGVRYSDEELEVKTPPMKGDEPEVGPLLLDSFSDNAMLEKRFSNHSLDRYGHKNKDYEAYAPTCVLAKLAAYYHPDNMPALHPSVSPNPAKGDTLGPGHELMVPVNPKAGTVKAAVNFGRLHWDPYESDPPWRTVETLSLFEEMHGQARAAKMQLPMLERDFLTGFEHMFRHKTQPEFVPVTTESLEAAMKLIKTELTIGRPVVVIESPQPPQPKASDMRIQWGLIDGLRDGSNIHIDFPSDTEFLKGKNERVRFTTLDTLIVKKYDLGVLIHISF